MSFERDKEYKTRNGKRVLIICTDAVTMHGKPIVGILDGLAYTWSADGSYVHDESHLDLICRWDAQAAKADEP